MPPGFELKRDPIDLLTGEHLDKSGRVPVRTDNLSTPSYARVPSETLWREIVRSSNHVFVVVKLPKQTRGFFQGRLLIGSDDVASIKRDMLAAVPGLQEARRDTAAFRLPQTASGMVFPGFFATIATQEALAQLRARQDLDYVEPMYPAIIPEDSFACGFDPYAPATDAALLDEQVFVDGTPDVVPYSFRHLGITTAWNRFTRPGTGVHLAVLDTGISTQQDQLQERFTVGAPRPPPTHLDTTGTGLEDVCGHGTKIAGLVAAPKDGKNIVGALWGATLTTVKVGGSPQHTISDSGASEVCGGIALAVAAHARIVMMAFGYPFYSPTIAQCITDAFDSTSMIFIAAAGTKNSWVVFPASMNREVIAVSAVAVFGPNSYRMYKIPLSVAYGPDVDFVSVMGDNKVPTTGRVGNSTTQNIAAGGGSSAAVPHIAAVFGLAIQSTAGLTPALTRAQIISRVRAASSISNVRDSDGLPIQAGNIGAGIPDAYAASGGTTQFDVVGPATVQINQPFTYSGVSNGDSPLEYTWTSAAGGTNVSLHTQTVTFTAPATGTFDFSVTAVDPVDGRTFQVQKSVQVTPDPVPPPTIRDISSADYVSANPFLLTGGRNDFVVNPGISMAPGCVVLARRGHTQCDDGGVVHDCADADTQPSADYSTYGFTVSTPSGVSPNSLDTDVHLWHDGVHGVAVRVHYTILQPAGISCDVDGHTQDRQVCFNEDQCASLTCSGLSQGGSGGSGTCASRRPLGANCSANAHCSSGYCDAGNGTSKTNHCLPNKNGQGGEVCSNDNQCTSLSCSGLRKDASGAWIPGTCADEKPVGASCSAHAQCSSGYCDLGSGASGTCTSKSSLGASCSAHVQCSSGYCDAGDGTSRTNRCMPNRDGQNGDICSNDNQCSSLNCSGLRQDVSGAWVPGSCASKRSLGANCSANMQCASGYCDAGDGTSRTNRCMPNRDGQNGDICSNNNQCMSSLACSGLSQDASRAWIPGTCTSKSSLGASCSAHVQCSSGYCDAGDGTSRTNRCMPNKLGRNGDICSNDNQCVFLNCSGLSQGPSGAWVPGTCAAKKSLGVDCSAHGQCSSGYCDAGDGTSRTNRCMPNKSGESGDICSDNNQCKSLSCSGLRKDAPSGAWIPGTCASEKGAGASCSAHAECGSGYCEVGSSGGICTSKSSLGASCSAHVQCSSGYCDAGMGTSRTNRCMPDKFGENGDICSNDNQCGSQNCSGLTQNSGAWIPGACAGKKSLGTNCSAHLQCGSGYCDAGDGTSRTNRCMPNQNGQNGEICSNDNQCGSQNCSGLTNVSGAWIPGACASRKALGDACSQHYQCSSGYCDHGDNTSRTDRCMPNTNGGSGDICSHPNQCASRNCVGLRAEGGLWIPGACASGKALGDVCSQHNQCSSGYCDSGNNTSRTDLCMPNTNGGSGDICSHHNQCASRNCVGLRAEGGRWIPGQCQ